LVSCSVGGGGGCAGGGGGMIIFHTIVLPLFFGINIPVGAVED